MRVLVVEDDPRLSELLSRGLTAEGLVVDLASDGRGALEAVEEAAYDAAVLDVGLPDLDGFALCRELRARQVWCPVLMLTAREAVVDRVEGLDAGADDTGSGPRLGLEPRNDEEAEAQDGSGDAVLDVVVSGSRLMAGKERGQAAGRVGNVEHCDDQQ